MSLAPGVRLGAYEVVAIIGAGGIGEVYRGRDSRLGRDVAIKILPAAFATDSERLQRFEQEARAVGGNELMSGPRRDRSTERIHSGFSTQSVDTPSCGDRRTSQRRPRACWTAESPESAIAMGGRRLYREPRTGRGTSGCPRDGSRKLWFTVVFDRSLWTPLDPLTPRNVVLDRDARLVGCLHNEADPLAIQFWHAFIERDSLSLYQPSQSRRHLSTLELVGNLERRSPSATAGRQSL
jgi:hypothetical protein